MHFNQKELGALFDFTLSTVLKWTNDELNSVFLISNETCHSPPSVLFLAKPISSDFSVVNDPMCSCSDSVHQLSRDALSERWETCGQQRGHVITRLRKVSHTSYVSLNNWPDANIMFILSLSRSISRSVWLQVSLRVIL